MFNLPSSTDYNKRIPKQRLCRNSKQKEIFNRQIKGIYWKNKIAADTTNLESGKKVLEIQVFLVRLNQLEFDIENLKIIDLEMPYFILFVLEYAEQYKAAIAYKEININKDKDNFKIKIGKYYETEWMAEEDLPFHIEGINTDEVYENFVRQIAGTELQNNNSEKSLQETVGLNKKIENLEKKAELLKKKVRKEKQFNRQMQLNDELKKIKSELEKLKKEGGRDE